MNERSIEYVPADLLAGLLDGWCGPVELHATWRTGHPWILTCALDGLVDSAEVAVWGKRLRLPLTRPEGRAQLARVLTVGERCAKCCGSRAGGAYDSENSTIFVGCPACRATGYLRKPAPVRWMLPATELGDLPPERAAWSAGLLACSAWRVAAGLGVVRGVLAEWAPATVCYGWDRRAPGSDEYGNLTVPARQVLHGPRFCYGRKSSAGPFGWSLDTTPSARTQRESVPVSGEGGPETGGAGRAAADAAALAAGFALADADGVLTLPWPAAGGAS